MRFPRRSCMACPWWGTTAGAFPRRCPLAPESTGADDASTSRCGAAAHRDPTERHRLAAAARAAAIALPHLGGLAERFFWSARGRGVTGFSLIGLLREPYDARRAIPPFSMRSAAASRQSSVNRDRRFCLRHRRDIAGHLVASSARQSWRSFDNDLRLLARRRVGR